MSIGQIAGEDVVESIEYKNALAAVKCGDEEEKTNLAWFKLSGRGGSDVDEDWAVTLLEEQVECLDPKAMWMLGLCKEFGMGTDQSLGAADKYYERSCNRKNEIGSFLRSRDADGKDVFRESRGLLFFFVCKC